MPMVSVPWSDPASVVVILLGEHITEGTASNLSYSISFFGPMLLGGMAWEILTVDVAFVLKALISCLNYSITRSNAKKRSRSSSNQSKESVQSHTSMRRAPDPNNLVFSSFIDGPQSEEIQVEDQKPEDTKGNKNLIAFLSFFKHFCSFLAKASALAFICLFIAYTHGDHEIQCGSWPHTLAGLAAAASSMINLSIFLNTFIVFPNASRWISVFCSIFVLGQFGMSFSTIAAWRGGLRPSGIACYLRFSRWVGIYHLGNLTFLAFLPLYLLFRPSPTYVNGTQSKHKHRDSALSGSSQVHDAIAPGALSHALSQLNRDKLTKRLGNKEKYARDRQDTLASRSDQAKGWMTAKTAASSRDQSSKEEDEKLKRFSNQETEGILILPGQPLSSKGNAIHSICVSDSNNIWTLYIIWWFTAICTALCGTIISFVEWSAILTL